MKLLYFNLLLFTIVFSTVAQKKSVFIKTIKTVNVTDLDFNINKQNIKLVPSKDKNIHINFVMDNIDNTITNAEFEDMKKLYSSNHKISSKTLKFNFIRKKSEKNSKIVKEEFKIYFKTIKEWNKKKLNNRSAAEKADQKMKFYEKPIYFNSRLTKKQLFKYAVLKRSLFESSVQDKRILKKTNRFSLLYDRAFYEIHVPENLIHKMRVFIQYGNFITDFNEVRDLDIVSISSKSIKFNKLVN